MRNASRRDFLRQAVGYSTAGVLGPLCLASTGQADENRGTGTSVGDLSRRGRETLDKAQRIHEAALTIDSHVDIFGTYYATERLDPGVDNPHLRCDLVKMAAGGMDGVFLAVYTGQGRRTTEFTRTPWNCWRRFTECRGSIPTAANWPLRRKTSSGSSVRAGGPS